MAFTKPPFKNPADRVIAAFDSSAWTPGVHRSLFKLRPYVGMIKVGAEAITARGTYASVADELTVILGLSDWNYMYDLKIKEISNSTVRAVRNLAERRFPPSIATVHATQRIETIAAALEAAKNSPMLIAAVSILSDHEPEDVEKIYNRSLEEVLIGCAERVRVASEKVGVTAGMVCAPMDLLTLREHGSWRYDSLVKIAVGIRPDGAPQNDQKRAMTPTEAIRAGADYLVIGRPIYDSRDPVDAAKRIVDEIASVS